LVNQLEFPILIRSNSFAMNAPSHPQLKKYAYILLILILSLYGVTLGQSFLAPLSYGLLVAIILLPLCNWIERLIPNRPTATVISVLLVSIPLLGLFTLFSWKSVSIFQELEFVNEELQAKLISWLDALGQALNLGEEEGKDWLIRNIGRFLEAPIQLLGSGIYSSTSIVTSTFMSLIFTLFFLLYRKNVRVFLLHLISEERKDKQTHTFLKVQGVVREFLIGRLLVILILAILNSLGLWLLGIKYAVFWGFLGAFFNIIPYIGTALGGFLPFLYAMVAGTFWWQPLGVVVMYSLLQFVEGNFITPKVVGDTVKLNPFIVIISLFAGGLLWGFAGIVIAVPVVAVAKVALEGSEQFAFVGEFLSSGTSKPPSTP
jgi:predicted PurR-regulated permease PerM